MQWGVTDGERCAGGDGGVGTRMINWVRSDGVRAECETIDVSPSIETTNGECQEDGIWERGGESS